ncbi:MAG: M23 family metallopeptidase [Pseudomonadota bacterium]
MIILAAFILQIVVLLVVPLWFAIWLAFYRSPSRIALYAKSLLIAVFLAFLFLIGRWDIVGIWFRYLWIGVYVLALGWALFRYHGTPILPEWAPRPIISLTVTMTLIVVFANAVWTLRNNASFEGDPVDLAFPIRETRWYAAHGGSAPAMNHHHHADLRAQNYALDIVGLNSFGTRAKGLLPTSLNAYAIFGRDVVAPCRGEVTSVENELMDLTPPNVDQANPAGNHVVIRCGDVAVLLAHLQQDTVSVNSGDEVGVGQRIAKVGNSGNTTEPHLHIHAIATEAADLSNIGEPIIATGKPIPMLFDGVFLTRNAWGDAE